MKSSIIQAWYAIRYSFWFVPALLTVGSVLLAWGSMQIDEIIAEDRFLHFGWLYSGTPDGVRTLLSTIAGSMITVAGVVFSLTMVVLSLTSSQFGPRLVRNFMDDLGNQLVLGTFVATFVYCLIVLRTIEGDPRVPHLSVTLGMGLALISLTVLIYFIHHIASSIQANNLLAQVGRNFEDTIERIYPEPLDTSHKQAHTPEPVGLPQGFNERAAALCSQRSGYIKMIDHHSLLEDSVKNNLLVKLLRSTGEFVVKGEPMALVWPPENLPPAAAATLHKAFNLGVQRNESQDPIFPAQLLTEAALRALSPGVNDPFTAVTCIDWLSSGLAILAGRRIPDCNLRDPDGELRVILDIPDMGNLIHACLDPIRRSAKDSVTCTMRLLSAIATLAQQAKRSDDVAALQGIARRMKQDGLSHTEQTWDRKGIGERFQEIEHVLDEAQQRCLAQSPEAD